MDKYLVPEATARAALAEDGMELEDYDPTIIGMISDGRQWQVLEDSLDEAEAIAWADRADAYGEVVGLFVWKGVQAA